MTTKNGEFLTREQILAQKDRTTEVVEAFGGRVTVQALSGKDRDKYEADMVRLGADGTVQGYNVQGKRARLLQLSVVTPDRKPMFRPADVIDLGDLDAQDVDRVLKVAMRLSGISDAEVEKATAGFTPDPTSSSGTDSPETSDTEALTSASPA